MARPRSNADPELVEDFAVQAARAMRDDKCEDVVLLDVRGLSQVCDYVLIGSGTSQRQMKTVAQTVADLGKERGEPPFRSNVDTGATWVVVDFVETVVHIFEPDHRMYYDMESLWATARRVDWEAGSPADPDPS